MKSRETIRIYQYGGPEQLKLESIPYPKPAEKEVLVKIKTAAVLPYDWKYRKGMFQQIRPATFPYIPGSTFAGIIEEVGENVTTFTKGQAVFGRSAYGTYTEYTTASIEQIALKPEGLSFSEAVTIPASALAAWLTLFHDGGLQKGQKILIHGAAGGFGMLAVQMAKWVGTHVIGTSSTRNVPFVYSLGADQVIDYTNQLFEEHVSEIDLVIDTVGGETLERSMEVVKRGGKLVSIVGEPSIDKAAQKGIIAIKPDVQTMPSLEEQKLISQQIADLMVKGKLKAETNKVFPLQEAHKAHILSETGHGRGRIILAINHSK
ncbi:NADP-dependent oxidoreductase [Shimazuella kribbensis]|uniref:NADP-dependent oxidoreductase n=1 Tax=Shimazuella kribbensis TaxID=139808 RepID=UPI000412D873|nr:NADP-dependent oxidoreductase [Shimazuella kribbensis]